MKLLMGNENEQVNLSPKAVFNGDFLGFERMIEKTFEYPSI